jgi:uncharacterized membrane protein
VIEATLLFPLVCVAIAALGIPLWVAMVKPNRFYGVRTAATLADEAVWYAANRATGRDLVASGFLLLVLSVALPSMEIEGVAYAILMTAAVAGGGAFVAIVGLARIRHLRSPL